jgi:hypothetical protein
MSAKVNVSARSGVTDVHDRDGFARCACIGDVIQQVPDENATLGNLAIHFKLLAVRGLELDLLSSCGHAEN